VAIETSLVVASSSQNSFYGVTTPPSQDYSDTQRYLGLKQVSDFPREGGARYCTLCGDPTRVPRRVQLSTAGTVTMHITSVAPCCHNTLDGSTTESGRKCGYRASRELISTGGWKKSVEYTSLQFLQERSKGMCSLAEGCEVHTRQIMPSSLR
jgi:hypothetical protein